MASIKSTAESLTLIVVLFVVFVLFILASPLFLLFHIHGYFYNKRFNKEYSEYLKFIDGSRFFCYNNRRNSLQFIKESILPNLPSDINIIFLDGRIPKATNYVRRFISAALYRIKDRKGFPYLLKVSNGQVIDKSVNNAFYNTMKQGKDVQLLIDEMMDFYQDQPIIPELLEFLTKKLGTLNRPITRESAIEES